MFFNICLSAFLFIQFDLPWWALVGLIVASMADQWVISQMQSQLGFIAMRADWLAKKFDII